MFLVSPSFLFFHFSFSATFMAQFFLKSFYFLFYTAGSLLTAYLDVGSLRVDQFKDGLLHLFHISSTHWKLRGMGGRISTTNHYHGRRVCADTGLVGELRMSTSTFLCSTKCCYISSRLFMIKKQITIFLNEGERLKSLN